MDTNAASAPSADVTLVCSPTFLLFLNDYFESMYFAN
jgi:hypothetical protein